MVDHSKNNGTVDLTATVQIETELLKKVEKVCQAEEITVEEFVSEAIPRYMNWIQELNEKGYVKNPDGTMDILIGKEAVRKLSDRAAEEGLSIVQLGQDILTRIIDEGIEKSLN